MARYGHRRDWLSAVLSLVMVLQADIATAPRCGAGNSPAVADCCRSAPSASRQRDCCSQPESRSVPACHRALAGAQASRASTRDCSCMTRSPAPAIPRHRALDSTDLLVVNELASVVTTVPAFPDVIQWTRSPLLELGAGPRALRERSCILRI